MSTYRKNEMPESRTEKKAYAAMRSPAVSAKPRPGHDTSGHPDFRRIADIQATLSPFWAWRLTTR